ncbi:MAG: GNAT family N-acetyltransferase [Promicromonosporaceae bacterium]|nr:GNAT family N-acetyltransferase [Promicromonosporaceae bacterium]
MGAVIYRDYDDDDAAAVKQIIGQAFTIGSFLTSERMLDSALEVYLRECLAGSSWTQVAELEGRVVGIIMGNIPGQPRVPGVARNRWLLLVNSLLTTARARGHFQELAQTQLIAATEMQLVKRQGRVKQELTLFAVAESARGLGIGKALYQAFLDYLASYGRGEFYVLTDSKCDVGFYRHLGLSEAEHERLGITYAGEPEELDLYLFTGIVPSEESAPPEQLTQIL